MQRIKASNLQLYQAKQAICRKAFDNTCMQLISTCSNKYLFALAIDDNLVQLIIATSYSIASSPRFLLLDTKAQAFSAPKNKITMCNYNWVKLSHTAG